jgi:hypothetical protein
MDNITITCENDMIEKIQIIMRQTDYDETTAREKLLQNQNDHIKVIKLYMGITEKKTLPSKSLNQAIYTQLRQKLDNSIKDFNSKQQEKLKNEIYENNK